MGAAAAGAGANVGVIVVLRTAGQLGGDSTERLRIFSGLGMAFSRANVVGPVAAGLMIDAGGFAAAYGLLLAMPLVARTPYTITNHQVLAEELARIRTTGLSYDREENSIGIVCVAAPILIDDRAIGAVSITCSPPRTDVERYAPAVKAAALGIRRTIARTPGLRPSDSTRGDNRS